MVDVQQPKTQARAPRRINAGIGRVLIWIYGLFALSAGARAGVQIATKFHVAPLAYTLSALAAVIYLVATICLARSTEGSRRLAIVCCSIELAGVIAVGAASVIWPASFPDATVWSDFGQGYGYVPLVLPMIGLWWLLRRSARPDPASG
jgi:cytochrome bd-type quinol oxidase subunit 2